MTTATFDPTEIEQHGKTVEAIGAASRATIAGVSQPPNPMMFGLISTTIVTPIMTTITQVAVDYLGGLGDAFDAASENLAETSKGYSGTEATAATGVTIIEGELRA